MSNALFRTRALIGIAAIVSVSMLGVYVWVREHRLPALEMHVFSLRSGYAAFIQTPDDRRILIDGGPNGEIVRKISSILPFYSRRIDAIVATETDGDAISGLIDVLERYQVGRMYIPAVTLGSIGISTSTDPAYHVLCESAARRGVEVVELESGDHIESGDDRAVGIKAVFPVDGAQFEYSKASAPRVILEVTYDGHSILLLGDVSIKAQKFIAESAGRMDIAVFSQNASPANVSRELMMAMRPEYLVYSKAVTASRPRDKDSDKTQKKPLPDPVAGILMGNRFNLKEVGTVHIVIDGTSMRVSVSHE